MTDQEFEEIFTRTQQDVTRLSFYYLRSKEDAEDIAMETFSDFYRRPPSDLAKAKAYLLKIATNKCMDRLKQRKKETLPLEEESVGNLDSAPEVSLVWATVMSLPKKFREAIVLYYLEGLSVLEAAEVAHVSVASFKKRLERGKKRLKEKIS